MTTIPSRLTNNLITFSETSAFFKFRISAKYFTIAVLASPSTGGAAIWIDTASSDTSEIVFQGVEKLKLINLPLQTLTVVCIRMTI
jgi:hypothetical protein